MKIRERLTTVRLLCALGVLLGGVLSACTETGGFEALSSNEAAQIETQNSQDAACTALSTALAPLTTPEDTPIFEQFNFQPHAIEIAPGVVTVKTPAYTFAFCQRDRTWSVTSIAAEAAEEEFDYDQYMAEIADPAYDVITVGRDRYEYRARLEADWLRAQTGTSPLSEDTAENTVYFELQTPNGKSLRQPLYSLSELQAANLGASLGVPSIVGSVVTQDAIWFAATATQGEGDSGFASLIRYSLKTGEITVQRPEEIQGDQITAIALTPNLIPESTPASAPASTPASPPESTSENITLWLGTQRSGEGNPYLPANGLIAYQPMTKTLERYTITNSPLVGAIPTELAVEDDQLWVGTGNGVCQVAWQTVDEAQSWDCWRFAFTAALPEAGIDLYPSSLADQPAATLTDPEAEVLWADWKLADDAELNSQPQIVRYEVVYSPGFEVQLAQSSYQTTDDVARQFAGGEAVFWPGHAWHWAGDRFARSLDEVSQNHFGGGPYGLMKSNFSVGPNADQVAIRGDFDLLNLEAQTTTVRHYSGWISAENLQVYPSLIPTETTPDEPNPLDQFIPNLPTSPGP